MLISCRNRYRGRRLILFLPIQGPTKFHSHFSAINLPDSSNQTSRMRTSRTPLPCKMLTGTLGTSIPCHPAWGVNNNPHRPDPLMPWFHDTSRALPLEPLQQNSGLQNNVSGVEFVRVQSNDILIGSWSSA